MTGGGGVGEHVGAAPCVAHANGLRPASGDPLKERERASCREHVVNAGHGKPDTGRAGPLPRAGAVKDRVDRTVDRLTSLSRAEDRMQLVGRLDQLGRLPRLAGEAAVRRSEFRIRLILLTGGCPRGIGELVDELHHPRQLDLRNRKHVY